MNLGGVVSPRNQPAQQQQASVSSPAPAAVPHPSPVPNTTTPSAQQQTNLIGKDLFVILCFISFWIYDCDSEGDFLDFNEWAWGNFLI